MALDTEEADVTKMTKDKMDNLTKELEEVYSFRDLFFEHHPIEMASEKNKLVEDKTNKLIEKFEAIDVDSEIPFSLRAQFLYLKGRCYNINSKYDTRAVQCLSKAVKLNPHMVNAWNELGECYCKNMNIIEAKASFEGALKHERHRQSLRCLSILLRLQSEEKKRAEAIQFIEKSVELAKEAVAQNIKEGISWMVLGNAYLCQFFTVAQDPVTLKLCMSAYKQAVCDPISKSQPDLYYNRGIALKYDEMYDEALESFIFASRLDPPWEPPILELKKLRQYLASANDLVRTKGKIKAKKLTQMVQNIDKKMLGVYSPDNVHNFGSRKNISLKLVHIDALKEGTNEGKVILGRVVGSIHNENAVPFTFAIIDESMECSCVTVYNWADGRGTIIGDCVAIPEPKLRIQNFDSTLATYNFKSIRVNNPMQLLVNGKRVGRNQFASTKVSSSYEIY